MRLTRGREALRKRLQELEWSQGDLARELGIDAGIVSRWATGKRVPELQYVLILQRVLAIDPALWTEDAEETDRGAA